MSNRPARIRQREITRGMKAARAAGYDAFRVEIDDNGKLVIAVGEVDRPAPTSLESIVPNSWADR